MIAPRSIAVAFVALLALGAPSGAQDAYPSKTITMIIPFAAGGSTDVIGRLVAEGLRSVLGQPIRGGQPRRRRRRAGHGCDREGLARRLHHRHGHGFDARDQSRDLQEPAVRRARRSFAHRQHRGGSQHHGDQSRGEGREHGGVHRAGALAAGQARLRLAGLRLGRASARRAVQARDRNQHPACALSRHGPGAHRCHRRPGAGGLRQPADVAGAGEGRQAARAWPVGRQARRGVCRTCRPSANSASTTSTGWRSSA